MLHEKLRDVIDEVINAVRVSHDAIPTVCDYSIEKPRNANHGDFALDLAFRLAKGLRLSPMAIAEEIVTAFDALQKKSIIQGMSVAKPGFINIKISHDVWCAALTAVRVSDDAYGATTHGNGKRILLEYVSANPTGPLTIAHGRQACLGDTLSRVMKCAGYDVFREYYLNDGGRQIMLLGLSVESRYRELLTGEDDECFPEDGYKGAYIMSIAEAIKKDMGPDLNTDGGDHVLFKNFAAQYLMDEIKHDLSLVDVAFDNYFSEQSLMPERVEETLAFLKSKDLLYEEDGALWFKTSDYGDDKNRVLRKSDGSFTYFVPDIAYHKHKYDRGYTKLVDFLGPDHHGYIKRLKAAAQATGHDPSDLEVKIVQLTTLYRNGEPFKMSTRAGDFISLKELIDEVGADAARFFFLMRKINSQLDFDLDLAKEQSQDNPVFYLQYAHARISSLLKYADRALNEDADLSVLDSIEEIAILQSLDDFPSQIIATADLMEPYRLVDYLQSLAALFHKFYAHRRVVTKDAVVTDARLLLCDAVRIVMRNGLRLLGVSQPEEM